MNFSWIVLAVAAAGVLFMIARARRRRNQVAGLGTVSDQWMAEQRLGREHDPQR